MDDGNSSPDGSAPEQGLPELIREALDLLHAYDVPSSQQTELFYALAFTNLDSVLRSLLVALGVNADAYGQARLAAESPRIDADHFNAVVGRVPEPSGVAADLLPEGHRSAAEIGGVVRALELLAADTAEPTVPTPSAPRCIFADALRMPAGGDDDHDELSPRLGSQSASPARPPLRAVAEAASGLLSAVDRARTAGYDDEMVRMVLTATRVGQPGLTAWLEQLLFDEEDRAAGESGPRA